MIEVSFQYRLKGVTAFMSKRKMALIGMAVLLMASLLAACTGDNNTSNTPPASTNNNGSDNGAAKQPVTFKYFNFQNRAQDKMASETTIGKILQEQTGVDFKIEYLVGDAETKSGVMMAGGDYPDVIALDGQYEKFLDAGALIPLDDLIEQHGPNIKRVYGPYFDQMRHTDGKIYILPYSANQGYVPDPAIGQGAFWIQRSVLKEFGYPVIKTLDQYFDLIRQYMEKYPTYEGSGRIGFAIYAPTGNFFTVTNASNHLAGYPNDGDVMIDMKTYEAKMYAASEYEKRWLKALNQLNAEKLFDPESFTMDQDQFLEKMTSGRLLGYFAYGWQVGEATNTLKNAGVDELRYAPLPVTFDKSIKDQYIDPPSFIANRGVSISVKAQDPARIIQYFDNLLKEENQVLVQWGEAGVTYEIDEKGRFHMTEEQLRNRNDNQYKEKYGWMDFEYGWPRYGSSSVLSSGNSYGVGSQPEIVQMDYTEGDMKILEAYGAETFAGYFSPPDERPWYPAWSFTIEQGSKEQLLKKQVEELQMKYVTQMVLADPGSFENLWNQYVGEFSKLNVAGYEQFMTEEVKKRLP